MSRSFCHLLYIYIYIYSSHQIDWRPSRRRGHTTIIILKFIVNCLIYEANDLILFRGQHYDPIGQSIRLIGPPPLLGVKLSPFPRYI